MSEPQISRLFYYPVKSFRGIEVRSLQLTKLGAALDRQWMLVDEKNQFVTQRTMPQLARIGVSIEDDSQLVLTQDGKLLAEFGLSEVEKEIDVKIWKDQVTAFEVSGEVSADLSSHLNKKVKLVRFSENCDRRGKFSDDQPLLVISEESLKGLEQRAKVSLSIQRFRPNIVVRDCLSHAEDTWSKFKLGEVSFVATKPCTRCRITQTHPLTGVVGDEPMKTMLTYRRVEKGVAFGFYYGNDEEGEIFVGQKLTI